MRSNLEKLVSDPRYALGRRFSSFRAALIGSGVLPRGIGQDRNCKKQQNVAACVAYDDYEFCDDERCIFRFTLQRDNGIALLTLTTTVTPELIDYMIMDFDLREP